MKILHVSYLIDTGADMIDDQAVNLLITMINENQKKLPKQVTIKIGEIESVKIKAE